MRFLKFLITVIVVAFAAVFVFAGPASAQGVPSAASLTSGYAAAIASDVAASVYDPSLHKEIWVTGDVTQVGSTSTVGYFGYPHNALVEETPGSSAFTTETFNTEQYGTDYWAGVPDTSHFYQFVPTWTDGTYFWPALVIDEGATLHVIGERIQGVDPFTVVGTYDAQLNASTLAFESVTAVPSQSGDNWSGYAPASGGYWLTSQQGEVAWVPTGDLDVSADWVLYPGAAPSAGGSWPVANGSTWNLFTAVYGGAYAEEYTSTAMTGPWAGPSNILALIVPQTDGGIVAHPDLPAPAGKVLISYDVNNSTTYDPQFAYVSK